MSGPYYKMNNRRCRFFFVNIFHNFGVLDLVDFTVIFPVYSLSFVCVSVIMVHGEECYSLAASAYIFATIT